MTFKFVKQLPEIEWPVLVQVPVDGGKVQEHEFNAVFKPLSKVQFDELKDNTSDEDFFKKILIGWNGLHDDDGNEIPFSKDMISELVAVPFVRTAITRAYQRCISGIALKN